MYLIGRLISLIIFVVILFIVCISIKYSRSRKISILILKVYIVILTIMGYFFIPHLGADVTRLIPIMMSYRHSSISNLLVYLTNSSTPAVKVYYFVLSKMNNPNLLPATAAFITFSFCFGVLINILRYEKKIKSIEIAISLFIFMSRGLTLQIISNIRTIMSLSIIGWCIYQEFYRNKKIKSLVLLYLLGASFHVMGQVMFLYRIVYFVIENSKNRFHKLMKIALTIFILAIICIYGQKYLNNLVELTDLYFNASVRGIGYSYIWEKILSIMSIAFCIYLIKWFNHSNKINIKKRTEDLGSRSTKKLIKYIIPLVVIDILAMFIEFNFFQRTSWYLTILCIPLVVYTIREGKRLKSSIKYQRVLIIFSIIMLLLACARGDLCSLKFFII